MVAVGEDCFVGHGVLFINDLFSLGGPSGGDKSLSKKPAIGNAVSIGSNATILPVRICDIIIGAGALVTCDIDKSEIYVGNPA